MHPEIILIFHLYEESFVGMMSESEPGSLPSFPINLCSEVAVAAWQLLALSGSHSRAAAFRLC